MAKRTLYYSGGFMKLLRNIFIFCLFSISTTVLSADDWVENSYNISIIDSVAAENYAYLTLDGYSNPV